MTAAPKVPSASSLQRAGLLLDRARLDLEVDRAQTVAMLARVLDHYDLFGEPHGRLLLAALRARGRERQHNSARSPAERAVRDLLRHGQPPWADAVAGALARMEEHDRAWQARVARVTDQAEEDGPRAVKVIEDFRRTQERSPYLSELQERMGWPRGDCRALLHCLIKAGWVSVPRSRRSLRPGPRAREAAAARQ